MDEHRMEEKLREQHRMEELHEQHLEAKLCGQRLMEELHEQSPKKALHEQRLEVESRKPRLEQELLWDIQPLGDSALLISMRPEQLIAQLETNQACHPISSVTASAFEFSPALNSPRFSMDPEAHQLLTGLTKKLEDHRERLGYSECVPGLASVALHYNPWFLYKSRSEVEKQDDTLFATLSARIRKLLREWSMISGCSDRNESRAVVIPVLYGGETGPDLAEVARHAGMEEDEIVSWHSGTEYLVHMIGFAPGFPYLGGLPPAISAPRRAIPRGKVPAGSVGIGGGQTGIYPIASPGGWQIIGITPLPLFRPQHSKPSLLQAGDKVRFKPITKEEYAERRRRGE